MERNMRGIGRMICRMGLGWSHGEMVRNMRGITKKAKNMEKVFSEIIKIIPKFVGTYTWNDGSKYVGNWVENKICGFGVYSWLDGRKYEGEWLNNNMHGKGVYTWKDGRRYEGEYRYDKKHGYGTYTWADGRKYEGYWAYGKQHGKGKYILPDGSIKACIWEDGKRVRWTDNEEDGNKSDGDETKTDVSHFKGKEPN